MLNTLQPLIGIVLILATAWLLSEQRAAIKPRILVAGLGLQCLLALLLLKWPPAQTLFLRLNDLAVALQTATQAGTSMVFGFLGGGAAPFETSSPHHSFVLAFQALPLILVMSALSALLFYWRILPWMVRGFAWLLRITMGTGGALGLGAAANVFVGMTEAPLLIRPYLDGLSRAALFALMVCGMATVAGTVMVVYAGILSASIPDALGHILTASLISAPAALMVAGIMVPETNQDAATHTDVALRSEAHSSIDAITRGTLEALPLWLNIIGMLIVMVALVSLANQILALLPHVGGEALSAQRLLGWIMAPVVWAIGVPWSEAHTAGALMGLKTVLNELVAYLELASLTEDALSDRSRLIMTYALCGFANLGSLGIMIGALATMAPRRRSEVVALGMKSVVAGTFATLLTGAIVALIL